MKINYNIRVTVYSLHDAEVDFKQDRHNHDIISESYPSFYLVSVSCNTIFFEDFLSVFFQIKKGAI